MKSTHYLILAILAYILPISIFGHWTLYHSIYFPISLVALLYLTNLKSIEGKEWPTYLYAGLHGVSISVFGISVFGFSQVGSLISLSTYWGILVYLISSFTFIICAKLYRDNKKSEYESYFNNNPTAIERDKKLNKLLGGWKTEA